MTRALRLATLAVVALATGSLLVRVLDPFAAPPSIASDYVPHLWATGALVVVVLSHSWAPTLAWIVLVIGSSASALGSVALVREIRETRPDDPATLLGALVMVTLLVPPAVAAAYATHAGQRSRTVVGLAWTSVLTLGGAMAAAFLARTLAGETGGVPYWAWLGVVGGLTATGLARDLRPAVVRTRGRVRAGELDGSGRALHLVRIFVDELVPGREAGRAEAAEDERGRLAADLHAEVLPSLRRALAEAEAGGTVERLAADLRSAVDEVESLLVARRSIVLEELGLVAAIEWLAERVEERSPVRVEIEVGVGGGTSGAGATDGDARVAGDGRPPRDVERAAFRIAQLALDNVVRHAPGASVRVSVTATADEVRMRIGDDAAGPPVDEAGALRHGRRGIADMREEARACGAAVEVGRGPEDRGTAVVMRWPA